MKDGKSKPETDRVSVFVHNEGYEDGAVSRFFAEQAGLAVDLFNAVLGLLEQAPEHRPSGNTVGVCGRESRRLRCDFTAEWAIARSAALKWLFGRNACCESRYTP